MAARKNPIIENKGVASALSRLSKREKSYRKMKVEPGMLMKIKGVKNRPAEEPEMLMKTKLVIAANRECY